MGGLSVSHRLSTYSFMLLWFKLFIRNNRLLFLDEEEYILRLDDIANTLKCWGAVSHIRNSLEKSKERPRIGKVYALLSFV